MEIKFFSRGGNKASQKRSDIQYQSPRISRARSQKNPSRSNLLEAIAKVNGNGSVISQSEELDHGVVRMKIVVRKQDLKQIMEAMGGGTNKFKASIAANQSSPSSTLMPSLCVEQRLNLLKKKHLLMRANLARQQHNYRHCSWSPALQSIPEEL